MIVMKTLLYYLDAPKVQTTDFIQWQPTFADGAATTALTNPVPDASGTGTCDKLDKLFDGDDVGLKKLKKLSGNIKFNDIFYKKSQTNDVLSDSMLLEDKLIYEEKRQELVEVTYGYSGVGKSFTLFGTAGENPESGLLQATAKI